MELVGVLVKPLVQKRRSLEGVVIGRVLPDEPIIHLRHCGPIEGATAEAVGSCG